MHEGTLAAGHNVWWASWHDDGSYTPPRVRAAEEDLCSNRPTGLLLLILDLL